MSRSVVCVSRTTGAGGEEVARRVAAQLGLRYVDDEIISRAADLAGVSVEQVSQAEHSRPLVAAIIESMATLSPESAAYLPRAAVNPTLMYSHLIGHVIRETAEAGRVVIVAHGGSHALVGRPEVLRVLVTASPETRAARLAQASGMDERAAAKVVAESDRERARYLDRFYQVKHELPIHYDLALNTDAVDTETAATLIVAAARSEN